MFRTDLLSIIRSLNTVYTAIGICHTGYVDLRVFENMALRRIFGPRRVEETGEWRRLHNEELNDLYC